MEKWFTAYKIPVGQWGKVFFDFLTTWLDWFFNGLSTGISAALEAMIAVAPLAAAARHRGARRRACVVPAPLDRDCGRRGARPPATS